MPAGAAEKAALSLVRILTGPLSCSMRSHRLAVTLAGREIKPITISPLLCLFSARNVYVKRVGRAAFVLPYSTAAFGGSFVRCLDDHRLQLNWLTPLGCATKGRGEKNEGNSLGLSLMEERNFQMCGRRKREEEKELEACTWPRIKAARCSKRSRPIRANRLQDPPCRRIQK